MYFICISMYSKATMSTQSKIKKTVPLNKNMLY